MGGYDVHAAMPGRGDGTTNKNNSITGDATRNEEANEYTWIEREDHICTQCAPSSAGPGLNIRCGTAGPLGSNTSNAIVFLPPVQVYSCCASFEHHACAMASDYEEKSGLLDRHSAILSLASLKTCPPLLPLLSLVAPVLSVSI
jgi:hypothetical protein